MVGVSALQYADEASRSVFVRERAGFRGETSVELGRDVDLSKRDIGILMLRGIKAAAATVLSIDDGPTNDIHESAPYDDQNVVGIAAGLDSFRSPRQNRGVRGLVRFPEFIRLAVCAQRNVEDPEAFRSFAHSHLHESLSLPLVVLKAAVSNESHLELKGGPTVPGKLLASCIPP